MPFLRQRVIGLAATGDDLHVAQLSISARSGRVESRATIERFLERPEALREAVGGGGARVVLVCDGAWCASRPMPITCAQWAGARDEVLASLDRMLPYSGEQAYVGLIEQRDANDISQATGGRLIAARRSSVDPWLRAIEQAIGQRPVAVLAPEMAMLGLGLQAREMATVAHVSGPAQTAHRLVRGAPVAMGERIEGNGAGVVALPGATGGGEQVTGVELAIAGALSERVAGDCCRPMLGESHSRAMRWAPTVAALLLAGVALAAAGPMREARLERAIDALQAERAAMVEAFGTLQDTKEQTERLQRLVGAYAEVTGGWVSAMPALVDAVDALPERSLLYRVQMRDGALEISGEAPAVRTVLERLTQNERAMNAALTAPPTRSPAEETLEVFAIRAQWRPDGGGQ